MRGLFRVKLKIYIHLAFVKSRHIRNLGFGYIDIKNSEILRRFPGRLALHFLLLLLTVEMYARGSGINLSTAIFR